jgi:hypothetical protein
MVSNINRRFRNFITADTLSFYAFTIAAEQHNVHDIRVRFTRKGNKWANVLFHMLDTGKAKSGKTMRQIYRYCWAYMKDRGYAGDFDIPLFNTKAKYSVYMDDDNGIIYVMNVSANKRYPLSINEMMIKEEKLSHFNQIIEGYTY